MQRGSAAPGSARGDSAARPLKWLFVESYRQLAVPVVRTSARMLRTAVSQKDITHTYASSSRLDQHARLVEQESRPVAAADKDPPAVDT